MSTSQSGNMPLTKEELIKLKHQIEPNDYRVVEGANIRILVIRSPKEFPDIVNDLEFMINKFDMRDTSNISQACLIGDAEVVGVSIDAINSLMSRRIEDDERVAADLAEKLEEPFSTLLFESDEDPLGVLRLGIRVDGKLEDFKPQQLQDLVFSKIKSLPRNSEVVYLIAEDGYVRLNGKDFYKQLETFLRENPDKNKDLMVDFIDLARGKMADHFVKPQTKIKEPEVIKQEQINAYIDQPIEEPHLTNFSEQVENKKIEKDKPQQKYEPIPEPVEPIDMKEQNPDYQDQKIETKTTGFRKKESEIRNIMETKPSLIDQNKESISGLESKETIIQSTNWPDNSVFKNNLKAKLNEFGFEIIYGIEVAGVDIVANNPQSIINKIFFTYMPIFNLKKAMELNRSLERFDHELCVIIGPIEDTDLKLFKVGKQVILVDLYTLNNTDFLLNLEAKI